MEKQGRARKMAILTVGLLILAVPFANAQQLIKRCPDLEVRSMKVSLKLVQNIPLDAKQEIIETVSGAETQDITVIARGPILGSMDSEKLNTDLACSNDGLVLTATISRSSNYHGAVRQNLLWFPRITIVLVPHRPEVALQTVWKMRLTNGRMLDRARTPPYPEQKYPITLTTTLHGRQS